MSHQRRPSAERVNKKVTFLPFMETPDRIMHRAIRSDEPVTATSANGSLNPMFQLTQPIKPGAAAPDPAKLSQLDRDRAAPKSPPGTSPLPPPPGEWGDGPLGSQSAQHQPPKPIDLK